jgi:hypothetical protein
MSEPEVVYEDKAIVLRRGLDDRGWLFIEQVFFPLPKYDNNVKHRVSLSPTGKTVELYKRWDGWAMGEGGVTGSMLTKIHLDEAEGAEIRKRMLGMKNPDDFGDLWSVLYWKTP